MKLKSIEAFMAADVAFVRATAEDRARGWGGQVFTRHSDTTCQVLHRQVTPLDLGAGHDRSG